MHWLMRNGAPKAGLSEHASAANLFTNAAARFGDPRYTAVAVKVVRSAIAEFYDKREKIFTDPGLDSSADAEHLMKLNGLARPVHPCLGEATGCSRPGNRGITGRALFADGRSTGRPDLGRRGVGFRRSICAVLARTGNILARPPCRRVLKRITDRRPVDRPG